MVITQQMQDTMNDQETQFSFQGMAVFLCLAYDLISGYDNIPPYFIIHGKGKNISGFINTSVHFIQVPDLFIIHQSDTDFTLTVTFQGGCFVCYGLEQSFQLTGQADGLLHIIYCYLYHSYQPSSSLLIHFPDIRYADGRYRTIL